MLWILANAESTDNSGSNLPLVLLCTILIGVIGGLAFVPVLIAWARRHRQTDAIMAAVFFWAVLSAWSVIATTLKQFEWSKERTVRLYSGYIDPQANDQNAPPLPWLAWGGLVAGFGGLIFWAASQKKLPEEDAARLLRRKLSASIRARRSWSVGGGGFLGESREPQSQHRVLLRLRAG